MIFYVQDEERRGNLEGLFRFLIKLGWSRNPALGLGKYLEK
jgi:hypothetical protein